MEKGRRPVDRQRSDPHLRLDGWGRVERPMNRVLKNIADELRSHAPFTAMGTLTGIAIGVVSADRDFEQVAPFRLSQGLKIGVISESDPSTGDVSDGVFTIGIPGQGRIRILMPDGGEEFQVGQETHIMWASEGNNVGSTVRLDISFDGGKSYQLLCNKAECTDAINNGDYRFGINFPPSDNVKIRVTSKSNTAISDVSNCSFRIVPARPPDPNAEKCPPPTDQH